MKVDIESNETFAKASGGLIPPLGGGVNGPGFSQQSRRCFPPFNDKFDQIELPLSLPNETTASGSVVIVYVGNKDQSKGPMFPPKISILFECVKPAID